MDDPTLPQKPAGLVPRGQNQSAVDANPAPRTPVAPPVWERYVTNSDAVKSNQHAVAAENELIRSSQRDTAEKWGGDNGNLIRKVGSQIERFNAEDYGDDPQVGSFARKSVWDRDKRRANAEHSQSSLMLQDPTFKARELSKTERAQIEAEGAMLAETDPEHISRKKRLMDDDAYRREKTDLEQKSYNAKVRAFEISQTDPDSHWQNRARPSAGDQRREVVAGAQAARADAEVADASAKDEEDGINTRLAQGVRGSELASLQARKAEIVAARALIGEERVRATEPIKAVQEEAKKEKDFFRLGDTVSGIWDAVKGLGSSAPAAFYQLVEGMERPDQYSESAKKAFAEADAFNKEMQAKTAANQKAGTSSSVGESFREAGGSLGFSLGSMAAAIPASIAGTKAGAIAGGAIGAAIGAPAAGVGAAPGAGLGAAIGGTIGGVTAGMAASGTAAYRMAGATFLNETFNSGMQEYETVNGVPMPENERKALYDALMPIAVNTALWEAGPEAVGNAFMLGAGKIILGSTVKKIAAEAAKAVPGLTVKRIAAIQTGKVVGSTAEREAIGAATKQVGSKFLNTKLGKLTAGLANLPVEITTEAMTHIEQTADQQKGDMIARGEDASGIKSDWSVGGMAHALKEVTPQTLALMALMGGGAASVKGTYAAGQKVFGQEDYKKDNARAGEALESVNTGLAAIDPEAPAATREEITSAARFTSASMGVEGVADGVLIERELVGVKAADAETLAQAQAALNEAQTTGGDVKAAEALVAQARVATGRADLTRAVLKVAAGLSMANLTSAEVTALGYKEDGEKITEMTPDEREAAGVSAPMLVPGHNNAPILTDAALEQVAAASPRARARITMDETQARAKALSTVPNALTGDPSVGVGLPIETKGAVEFDVPMRDGTMLRVAASTPELALEEAANVAAISGQPATPVATPVATPSQVTKIADGHYRITTASGFQEIKMSASRDAEALAMATQTAAAPAATPAVPAAPAAPAPGTKALASARAKIAKVKKNSRLAATLTVSNDPADRAETVPDKIVLNPESLIAEALAAGMSEADAVKYFERVLDEEIRHLAQLDAAKMLWKRSGGAGQFNAWKETHYGAIWRGDFAGEKGEIVRGLYTGTPAAARKAWDAMDAAGKAASAAMPQYAGLAAWDAMSDANKAFEAIRMMSQGKKVTEAAKLWVDISDTLRTALKAALAALRKFADAASPEILAEIGYLEAALQQLTGPVKAAAAKPTATPAAATPAVGAAGPIVPGARVTFEAHNGRPAGTGVVRWANDQAVSIFPDTNPTESVLLPLGKVGVTKPTATTGQSERKVAPEASDAMTFKELQDEFWNMAAEGRKDLPFRQEAAEMLGRKVTDAEWEILDQEFFNGSEEYDKITNPAPVGPLRDWSGETFADDAPLPLGIHTVDGVRFAWKEDNGARYRSIQAVDQGFFPVSTTGYRSVTNGFAKDGVLTINEYRKLAKGGQKSVIAEFAREKKFILAALKSKKIDFDISGLSQKFDPKSHYPEITRWPDKLRDEMLTLTRKLLDAIEGGQISTDALADTHSDAVKQIAAKLQKAFDGYTGKPAAPAESVPGKRSTTVYDSRKQPVTISWPADDKGWQSGVAWATKAIPEWKGTVGLESDVIRDKAESMRQKADGRIKDILDGSTTAGSRPTIDLQFWIGVFDYARNKAGTTAIPQDNAEPAPVTDSSAPGEAVIFVSGLSRSNKDMDAEIAAGNPIGVSVADSLTEPMRKKLVDYVNGGGSLFIDSGAVTAFHAKLKGDTEAATDWEMVMARYKELFYRINPEARSRVYFVAPDVVGDFDATAEIQQETYGMFQFVMEDGGNIIMPVQKRSDGDTFIDVGSVDTWWPRDEYPERFVIGIPFNDKAWTQADVIALLGQDKKISDADTSGDFSGKQHQLRIHLLGGGSMAVFKLIEKADSLGLPFNTISGDSFSGAARDRKFAARDKARKDAQPAAAERAIAQENAPPTADAESTNDGDNYVDPRSPEAIEAEKVLYRAQRKLEDSENDPNTTDEEWNRLNAEVQRLEKIAIDLDDTDVGDSFSVTPFESASDGMNSVENREEAERLFSEGKKLFAVSEMDEEAVEIESLDQLQGYTADQIFWQDTGNAESATTQPSVEDHANGMILTEGNTFYADSKAMNQLQKLPRLKHDHVGMGDFRTTTPHGKVDWARWPEKTVPGMSGRVHKLMGPIDAVTYLVEALKAEGTFESNPEKAPAAAESAPAVAAPAAPAAAPVDPALEKARQLAKEALSGLFASSLPVNSAALRASQLPSGYDKDIPPANFPKMMEAAFAMIQAGVNTPEKLAAELDQLAPERKAVPYSQKFWMAMQVGGAKGKANPKWADIYRKIDKASEQAELSTEDQNNEQTQRDGNSGSATDVGTEKSASRPGESSDPALDPSAGGNAADGGIQPGQPDGSGRSELPGGSVPGSNGNAPRGGDNDGTPAGDSGSGGAVDRDGVRNGTRPELGSPEANFVIGDGFSMPKGEKARIAANLRAITLLREIEAQGRDATLEEKQILSAYSGWGSFKNAFNRVNQKNWTAINERLENASPYYRDNIRDSAAYQELSAWRSKWGELFDTLDEMLSPEEFRAMSKSIRNAHFTALPIIDSMWSMVRAMGFKGGNVLETSVGAGYFVGRQPVDMANVSKWSAVELDSITARVFSKLYPESRINGNAPDAGRVVDGQGFQKSKIPNNSQDLIIGNFPFAKDGPMESLKEFGRKLNLHNYFFARSIDKLKPGGILIAITSNSTMDNNIIQRELIAGRVELVQAIRLPNDAFKENAGTEVTTDILILRKKDGSRDAQSESWTNVESVGEDTVYAKQGDQSEHAFLSEISPDWVPVDEELREPWKEWRAKRPKSGVKWDALTRLIHNRRYGSQGIPFRAKMVVNEYFARHPETVIGRHALEGSMYSAGSYAVVSDGVDVQARLNELIKSLPSDLFEESELGLYSEPETIEASAQHRNGSIVLVNDQPHHVVQGELVPVRWDLEYTEDFLADAKEVKAALAGKPELTARFKATFDTLSGNMLSNWIDGFLDEHLTPETAKKIRDKIAKEVARRHTVFKSWVKVRDAARALMDAELRGDPAGELYREALNQFYDAHVAEHGAFSARSRAGSQNPHKFLFDEDDSPLLESLEDEVLTGTDDKGKPIYRYEKRPIFTESMVSSAIAPTSAKDIKEAVGTSMGYKGRISLKYMAGLLGVSKDEAAKQLAESGLAFKNPKSGLYETADFYLSGEVRAKLREAEEAEAFEPGIYRANIEALTKIKPENRPIQSISIILGNRWLPGVIYSKFGEEVLGMDTPEVRYEPASNIFRIKTAGDNKRRRGAGYRSESDVRAADPDYLGTNVVRPEEIFENILNSRETRVMMIAPNGSVVVNPVATIEAQTKANQMMEKFAEWVKTSKDEVEFEGKTYRIGDLAEQEFNDKVAGLVTPTYVGEWVTLPGQSGEIWLKPHRKAVLARLLTMGYGMMAHGVGSGKTYNQIALAMELRRLGKARRVVTVVQNSTIRQFAASHMKAYPHAKILVADEENFSARKRARFLAKIATGDYDSIIMTHSNISQIGHDEQAIRNYMARAMGEMEEVLAGAEAGSQQQADIQAALDGLQEKLEKLLSKATSRAGSVLTWEQLGVDAIIVDEAHEFKNAPIITRKERIKNLPASGTASDRAVMMQMKTRSVQGMTGGRNVFFATGTPITNTMAEAYTMLNFIAPHILESKNINNFDDFATMFGRTVSEPEATWRGAIEMVERFAKFVNGPELVALIRSVFDVALGNENLGIRVPHIQGGGPEMLIVEPTEASEIFNDWVIDTGAEFDGMENKRQAFMENPWMQAIPIMIMQAGMAQAIDPRLINPLAPDDPASKVNQLVARMIDIYKGGTARKTAQVVFTDLSNPFSTLLLKQFNGDPFAEYGDVTPEMADLEAQIVAAPTETPADKKAKGRLVTRLSDLAEKRFSLMDDIKQKLIAANIPASEIFLADSSVNPKKLKESFDKVNSGEIRIIIGSTARLGTGVNIQERLAAAHNLSPPRDFKPAMMEQRIGRIERQGNLHRDWADQALVHMAQKMAGISFDAKKLEDRYEMAIDWLEKNGTDKQKEIARKAEARFEIIVINYGLKFSMDSSVYSMMKAKQKFIDQVLMGENVTDEFDDPMSAESNAFALMAAEAMGDENLKRRVILDGELNKLTALRTAYFRDKQNRENALDRAKNDVRGLTLQDPDGIRAEGKKFAGLYGRKKRIVKTTKGAFEKIFPGHFGHKLTAEQQKEPWEREVEAPVYTFADQEIDTAKPDQTITKPLNIFIADAMVDAQDTGDIVTRDITLNGERFVLAVSHYKSFGESAYSARVVWPGKVAGRVVFEASVNVSGESPASSLLDGIRSLSSPDYAEKYASNIEKEIALHQQTVATLEPLVANPRPFAEEQEWREKARESIEVNRLLAQANSDPRKHRYFRSLSRMVGEDATEQILGIDGKEGLPDVAPDVWNRMFIRFRLGRRDVQNNPAAIAKRLRGVVDADTGQAAAEAAATDAEGSRFDRDDAANPIAGKAATANSTPEGFMFPSSRYRKQDGRLATLRGIQGKLADKLEALEARDMFGLALADKREQAAKIEATKKPLEKIRAEIAKLEKAKYQETMRGEAQPLRASSLPPTDYQPFVRGTLGVPRGIMPQVKSPDRAEFFDYLQAQGIPFSNKTVSPQSLRPVQVEFSPSLVELAKNLPEDRRILISSDNYVLDGHHQWMAQSDRTSIKVTRLELPVMKALSAMRKFPQVQTSAGALALGSSAEAEPAHRKEGNFRSNWKITKVGRNLLGADGNKFTVDSIDIAGGKLTLRNENGKIIGMPIKQAEKAFMVELDDIEIVIEPIYEERRAQFSKIKKAFDDKISAIAGKLPDASPLIPDLKGMPRALEKAAATLDKSRDEAEARRMDFDLRKEGTHVINSMGDILRASIIVDNETQVMSANAAILRTFVPESRLTSSTNEGNRYSNDHVSIIIDDRFAKPTPAGYSDVQMKIEVGPGMFAELQVHIPEMLIAKEGWFPGIPEKYKAELLGVPNGLGHKYYEEYRTYRKEDRQPPRKLELERLMREPYQEAIRAAKRRLASTNSSQVNGPRVSAPSGQGMLADLKGNGLPVSMFNPNTPPSTATGTPSSSQNTTSGEKGLANGKSEALTIENSQDSLGVQDNSANSSNNSGLARLMRGDQGADTIEPTGQEEWAKRNPVSAAKLRAAVDRQAKAKNYTTEKVFHATASTEKTKEKYPYAPGDLRYTGTKPEDWDEPTINERGAFYVVDDKDAAGQFGWLKTRYKSLKGRTIELYVKQGNYFDSSNPNHMESVKRAVTQEELKASNDFWDDFHKKNPEGGFVNRNTSPPQWGQFWKKDIVGWQGMEDSRVIAKLKELGFEGYRSREMSPDEDNEIDFVSLGVFNPSSVKSADLVTFDKDGKPIPIAERFDDSKDSILRASTLPPQRNAREESARHAGIKASALPQPRTAYAFQKRGRDSLSMPLIENAEEQMAAFGPGSMGTDPRFANPGATQDTRNDVDIIRAYDSHTREIRADRDTFAKARELFERDPAGVEELALGAAFGDGRMAISDHEQLAIEMLINQRAEAAGSNRDQQVENYVLIHANIMNRRETARTLRIGFDKFMKPAERQLQQLADAIYKMNPKIEAKAKTLSLAERKAFLQGAGDARIAEVEKALAKMGLTLDKVIGKNRDLQLENSRLMREVLKTRDLMDQKIVKMVQKGATLADIRRVLGKDAAAKAQEVVDKARQELYARIEALAKSGMSREQIREAMKEVLKAGTLGGSAASGMTPEEIWKMIAEDFGVSKVIPAQSIVRTKKATPKAVSPLSSNWARPEFADGMNSYAFDAKDRAGIMERVEIIRGLAGALGKIDGLTGNKRAQADAALAQINAILRKYGTDAAGIFTASQGIEDYGFDINDIAQVAAVARAINAIDSDMVDKATEYLYFSMLSGLQTMLVNATAIVPAAWESTVGRGVELAINHFIQDPMSAQTGEAKYILKALAPAISRAKSNFVASMAAQHPMFDRDVNAMEVDWDKILGGGSHRMIGSITGRKGDIIRLPMRLLTATDDFNRTLMACCEVGAFAYRVAKAKGLKPGTPEFDRFLRVEVNTPGSFSYQLASKKASSAIFSNPLPGQNDPHTGKAVPVNDVGDLVGFVAGKITDAVSKEHDNLFLKAAAAAFRISFFPFQRTPFNILRKGIRHTLNPFSIFDIGLGIVQNSRGVQLDGSTKWEWNAKGRNPELIERAGQQLQGAVLMVILVAVAAGEGDDDDMDKPLVITGSLPFMPKNMAERDARMRSGIGAYRISFRRKDGSERFGFSYGRLEPVATTLSATIDTIKSMKRSMRSGGNYYDASASALGGLASQAQDKTFMRGVSDLIGLVKNVVAEPDLKENRKALQFLAGRVAMAVPNIIKQPIREADGQFRERSNGAIEELLYQIAPAGQKPAKIDPYGQVIAKPGTIASRPWDVTDMGTNPVQPWDAMLIRWQDSGKWSKAPDPSDRKPWFPAPILNAEFKHPKTGQNVKMSAEQLATFREMAGKRAAALLKSQNLNMENPTAMDVQKVKDIISQSRSEMKKALAFKFSRP